MMLMTRFTSPALLDVLMRFAIAAILAGSLFVAFFIASTFLDNIERARNVQMFRMAQAAAATLGDVQPPGQATAPAPEQATAPDSRAGVPHQAVPEGVLRIPKLGIEVAVFPGTDAETLRSGAGRVEWTPPLGSDGNVGVAAHRDGAFASLRRVAAGDTVLVDWRGGTLRYRVTAFYVVNPEDVHVLDPTPTPQLTLITCYPFDFIGAAPRRFIVHAELMTADMRALSARAREARP